MKKIEVELDQETYDKIQQLTQTHHCQLSDLIKAMIEQLTQPEIINDSFIGKWSDDAELVDKMIEDINLSVYRKQDTKSMLTDEEKLKRLNELFGVWKEQPELTEIFAEIDTQRHAYRGRLINSID